MKLYLIGPAFAAALVLAACGITAPTMPPIAPGPVAVPSGATTISAVAQKALYAAETAYNVPAQAYRTLDQKGAMSAAIKAKAKPALQAAYQALLAARHAAAAGDSVGVIAATNIVTAQAGAAAAVLPTQ